ncbi:MAG TPA: hypothetical protein PKC98_19440, partial [Candidatus Melainabacteria bacterium]|nr:hypothetical protein [Candidatus Melainabacteria bacterium]
GGIGSEIDQLSRYLKGHGKADEERCNAHYDKALYAYHISLAESLCNVYPSPDHVRHSLEQEYHYLTDQLQSDPNLVLDKAETWKIRRFFSGSRSHSVILRGCKGNSMNCSQEF